MNLEYFRNLLTARRHALRANPDNDAAAIVELDQTRQGRLSRMDAMQQQAMAAETGRRRTAELPRVDAALARIDAGDYGFCRHCDEAIPEGRLRIDPAATLCVGCAEKAETE